MSRDQLFDEIETFPNPKAANRFQGLVGLDHVKERLVKEVQLLLNPTQLEEWSQEYHGASLGLLDQFRNRAPFFVLGGDVGTGKTTLAESFGDVVARNAKISIDLFRLSLSARGSGAVGEMTRLLTVAFEEVRAQARKGVSRNGRPSAASILLIDEADAIAQSREFAQMHHEDRAGVNAVIRGIDTLASEDLPVVVVMCTNRLDALDPAVKRRAAEIFSFCRPSMEQRVLVLTQGLEGVGFSEEQLEELARVTGPTDGRSFGFTYSDLVRRYLPSLLIDAFPSRAIGFERAIEIATSQEPTPPFRGDIDEAATL